MLLFAATQAVGASAKAEGIAGSYDVVLCSGGCTFGKETNVVYKGRMDLFAHTFKKTELQRLDENRLAHHHGEPINGCFTLNPVCQATRIIGVERIGVTSWTKQDGQYWLSLYHSVDAGYAVELQQTKTGLSGTGTLWGVGVAAPKDPSTESVRARRTGPPNISHCVFQTPEEHAYRQMLADPARAELFAIEDAYFRNLLSELKNGTEARDWAMAGWIDRSESSEAQILRARDAAPDDPLIRWMTAVRTRPYAVTVAEKGIALRSTIQYREFYGGALIELQHLEPGNAIWWLMSLRNAVDHSDWIAADAALVRVAACDYYDDHAADLLKSQLTLYQSHPLPQAYFGAVARLEPGWRLNGEFTPITAPYFENHYPWTGMGIRDLFYMDVESGMRELSGLCVQQRDGHETRNAICVRAARMLSARARRDEVREAASRILSELNDFVDDDVRRARNQEWADLKFYEVVKSSEDISHLAYVDADIAFIDDWIEFSDELEAMQRALLRGAKPLQPPEEYRLNASWFENFERARTDDNAKAN